MHERYFQFPLCLLSFGRDVKERLNGITSFGCVQVGMKQWNEFSFAKQDLWRSTPPSTTFCISEIDLGKDEELQVIAGCEYLNIACYDINEVLADYAPVARFIVDFEGKYGTDARVRIRTDWVFEVLNNSGMSYREFAVLSAIYSIIGDSEKPVRILREDIRKRAHGFKSDRVFRAEMEGRPLFLTQRQVRSLIEPDFDERRAERPRRCVAGGAHARIGAESFSTRVARA